MKIKFKIFFLYIFFLVSPYVVYPADNEISEYDYLKFLGDSIEKIKTDYIENKVFDLNLLTVQINE